MSDEGARGVSAFLVEGGAEGLKFGANERKMGWNAQPTRAVIFDDCRVPAEHRLGEEGVGFKIAMAGLWTMRNGYALCSASGLKGISGWLATANTSEVDDLRGRLRIGLHRDVEVTSSPARAGAQVSQAFCSALPVAYSNVPSQKWQPFAVLVLEAAYEAALLACALQAAQGGSNKCC